MHWLLLFSFCCYKHNKIHVQKDPYRTKQTDKGLSIGHTNSSYSSILGKQNAQPENGQKT